ncbi:SAM-dependent methyltransferase [Acrocarpospora phusangensis]|nr:class I SAM-dependent methyltransferase [Acrocarpospora phusangensis]
MNRQLISHIAHSDHQIAAPITEANLDNLLVRAKLPARARILDLGCGEGVWILRALSLYPDATADGVDISPEGLASAAEAAKALGLADHVRFHQSPADDFDGSGYDLVLCVGATHAFGGLTATVEAIRRFVKPGGLALVGEGFWETPPGADVLTLLGAEPDEYGDLAATVARAETAGFATIYAHTSEIAEWDEYEWSWTGSLLRWAHEHPGPDGDAAREAALDHRNMWLNGYRGVLGFVTLLLKDTTAP